ncbi:MAG: CBS domain-containing protein, partial [Elusimicrobia bacterium]|nr:CBS domain-containing protein [Elusimicrobiota bacterium]
KEVMTKDIDAAGPACSVKEAARRMLRYNIGMLPIMMGKRVVGIVTDRDIVVRVVAKGACLETTRVGDIMTRPPVFCLDEDQLLDAAKVMEEKKIRRMPVKNRRDKLVGILSVDDFAKRITGQPIAGEVLEALAARHA